MAIDVGGRPPARPSLWNDPNARAVLFQVITLVLVVAFGWTIFDNTLSNLERQGIASGFGFMNSTAGFGIIMHLIPYTEESSYGVAFLVGLLNTLLVSAIGVVLATIVGFLIGVARLSSNWLISRIAAVYIEVVRNIPLLLQIFFWYFAVLRTLPSPRDSIELFGVFFLNIRGLYTPAPIFLDGFWLVLIGVVAAIVGIVVLARWAKRRQDETGETFPVFWTALGMIVGLPLIAAAAAGFPMTWDYPVKGTFNLSGGASLIPELVSLLAALTLYTAAFIAEIVRAGILAVSHGQTEAAHALGLRPGQTLRLVVIPQALRVIVPPLTSQYLNLTKNSSLAAAIAYPELVSVFAGTVLNQTGQAVEVLSITMAVYLTISLLISFAMNVYNRRIALVER